MRNGTSRETRVLGGALTRIAELLPASWALSERREALEADLVVDAIVRLAGPDGSAIQFVVEVKGSASVPASAVMTALRALEERSGLPVLFVADYIGPSLREMLARESMSYADATGWVRIAVSDPLILLTGQGAAKAPRDRTSTAVTRLNGVAAGRTIRALSSTDLPIGVRDLATAAQVSPGSVSKLLTTLAAEGTIDRDGSGKVIAVRQRDLVRRWVRDYSYARSNVAVEYFIAPRGLPRALDKLADLSGTALTGSAAARELLPEGTTSVVPLTLLALYAAEPEAVAQSLRLISADTASANVVIATPQDSAILPAEGSAVAPTPLVVADLLTLPGRSDAEAEQLMDTLAQKVPGWEDTLEPRP